MATLTIPNEAELIAFSTRYALGGLGQVRGIQGGTVNSSFAIRLGETPYFLRIYEEQGVAGATAELSLLRRLVERKVPTPPPVATRAGDYVSELAGKPAALFQWSPGEMRCQKSVRPADTRKLGVALARMHLAGAGESPRPGRFDVERLLERCERIRAADAELATSLAAGLQVVSERRQPLPSGLIHGDLFRDNVLWQGDDLSALIDFESASYGTYAYDLMVTTLAWCMGDSLDGTLVRALFAGYQSQRPLSEGEKEALCVEGSFACHRFAITRITDNAIRIGKDYRRFIERNRVLTSLGARGVRELCGV